MVQGSRLPARDPSALQALHAPPLVKAENSPETARIRLNQRRGIGLKITFLIK